MVLISAHRCGAGDDANNQNGLHALGHTLTLTSASGGVDYVEFDVRRMPDDSLVVTHDEPGDGVELLAYAHVLERLAGHAGAHIDLKAEGYEIEATEAALLLIPADRIVVTTGSVSGARRLRDWADECGHPIRVGLSTGTSLRGLPPLRALISLRRQLFPWRRYAAARADVLCAHHVLAALTLRRLAARRGLDLLVWTVDDTRLLRWWLRPGRAWMVTTNHPARALGVRPPGRMPS